MNQEQERVQMARKLRRAGYRDPVHVAARLQSEGVGPAELDWRLRAGQSLQKTSKNPLQQIQLVKSKRPHKIGMEVPRGGSSCASCRYLVDSYGRRTADGRDCSLALWVNAPKRDGGGGGNPELPLPANRWCCDGYEIRGTKENPLSRSSTDLLLLAGGVAAVGLVGYLVWKQQQAAAVAAATLPPIPGTLDVTGPPGQTATNLLPPPGTTVAPPIYLPGGSPLPVAPSA